MEALEQQMEKALILAFGDDSRPLHQFRAVEFAPMPRSVMDMQLLLDRHIAELEAKEVGTTTIQWQFHATIPPDRPFLRP
jgi:hypothetical protein